MEILDRFPNAKVLVVGDVMLDRYWWGSVSRISPEAPVPVVRLKNATLAAGGAANVAVNLAGLGTVPILIGIVGNDAEAGMLREILAQGAVWPHDLIEIAERPTTVKTRVIAHSQQVARIDQEFDEMLDQRQCENVMSAIKKKLDSVDVVVVSDYAKGMLTNELLNDLIEEANAAGKSVLVDPKGKDYLKYRGASLITPNSREAADACNLEENGQDVVDSAGSSLLDYLDVGAVLITQGEDGMTLFQKGRPPLRLGALARQVYDVTGAGDTVIATLAASLASGAELETAAKLANIAAGFVVEQVGTTSISLDALRNLLSSNNSN